MLRNKIRKVGTEAIIVIPEPPDASFAADFFHVYGTAKVAKVKLKLEINFSLDRILERLYSGNRKVVADCVPHGPVRLSIDAVVAVPCDRVGRVDVPRLKLVGKTVLDVWNDAVYKVPRYRSALLDEVLEESKAKVPEVDLGEVTIDLDKDDIREVGGSVGTPIGEDEQNVYDSMRRMYPDAHIAVKSLLVEHVRTGIVLEFRNIGMAMYDDRYVFHYGKLITITLPFRIVSGDVFYTTIPRPWTSHWTECNFNNKLRMFRTVIHIPY